MRPQNPPWVRANPSEVTHVFFHTLIMDTAKAFDGDSMQNGYNQMMTTRDEFLKILQSMYDRGYVLVSIHDVAREVTDENGNVSFVPGDIMLPEGKKPFVMSQDDVCYYEYMEGDGFASRLVIGEDGKPTCQMDLEDGTTVTGSYDLIPLLEDFIQEHPDFSYRGARAIIAFTGYNGVMGYRTDSSYEGVNPNIEEDRETVRQLAQCLRDNGWELASHSWGHRDLGSISYEEFVTDTDKWEQEVESLIGPTDIILYPFGAEIGDWHPYTMENERFAYLHGRASATSATWTPASTGCRSGRIICARAAATWTATACTTICRSPTPPRPTWTTCSTWRRCSTGAGLCPCPP